MSLNLKTVLISEPVDPICADILTRSGIQVVVNAGITKQELLKEIESYDGLVVRSATKVTKDVISAGKQLKIIGRAGVGVDNIDCDAATKQGVLVINAPGGNTISAAELTCGMIVSLSRNIPEACASLKSGKWDRKSFMGHELQGKTLAIIGLGRIGREVAHRMQSYGMKTIGYDPWVPGDVSSTFGVESMQYEYIWPLADYITVHTPLMPETKHLINEAVLSKCRKGVRIINCARGGIVDEDALVSALNSGQCGGAGFDVFTEEPPKNLQLIQHPKVICTPHLGASTDEAQTRVAEEIALQFVELVAGRSAHGIVNSPAFCMSIASENKPWVFLCKTAGAAAALLFPQGKNISFSLRIHGPDIKRKEKLFSAAVLIGGLKQQHNLDVNFINAQTFAEEKGLKVTDVNELTSLLPNSIEVLATSTKENHSILATLRGEDALLYAIDGANFKTMPFLTNNLIFCRVKHSPEATINLLGTLMKNGIINSVSWSTVEEQQNWCIIDGSSKCDKMPTEVSNYANFWGRLNL